MNYVNNARNVRRSLRLGRLAGAVAAVLAAASVLLAAEGEPKPLRLEEIFSDEGMTGTAPTQMRWSSDGRLGYILERDGGEGRDLWVADPASGEKRILVGDDPLRRMAPSAAREADERERERRLRYSVASYRWSPDAGSILFMSAGRLYLYHLADESARPLAPEKSGVRDPKFSPNGRWVSFVHEHDLWLVPTSGGDQRRLTAGGGETLLHGDLDWVYPEEFGLRSGYEWSPDSRRVAFLEFDQSEVPSYPIPGLLSALAGVAMQRYPKAGDANPRVRVGIVAARPAGENVPPVRWVDKPAEYTPRIQWADDRFLAVQQLNRAQNELRVILADAENGRVRELLRERDPHWINITDDWKFLKDSRQMLWTSERSGYRHIYLYGLDGRPRGTLTEGDWEVGRIAAVDEAGGWVYYTSKEDNALGADLYRVALDGSGKQRLTDGRGTHGVLFSNGFGDGRDGGGAYVDMFSALGRPPRYTLRSLSSGKTTSLFESRSLDGYGLADPELLEIRAPGEALIRGMLLKPRGLEAGRKYPLLVYVYGGPRAPTIRDAWGGRGRYLFHQYLTQKGYGVLYIDDRASSLVGHRHETALSRNYGPAALADHETAVEYIKSRDWVDPDRIGIWGWSGGGFSTLIALTKSKLFRLGIAVAPVTDWRLYDSIYTERYMGLPADEAEAYRVTSAVEAAGDLSGRLLLVHGTADDNVHIQNTMKMIDALIAAGKPYDLLVYPGKTHSIRGAKARLHLFRSLERYLDEHL